MHVRHAFDALRQCNGCAAGRPPERERRCAQGGTGLVWSWYGVGIEWASGQLEGGITAAQGHETRTKTAKMGRI